MVNVLFKFLLFSYNYKRDRIQGRQRSGQSQWCAHPFLWGSAAGACAVTEASCKTHVVLGGQGKQQRLKPTVDTLEALGTLPVSMHQEYVAVGSCHRHMSAKTGVKSQVKGVHIYKWKGSLQENAVMQANDKTKGQIQAHMQLCGTGCGMYFCDWRISPWVQGSGSQ